METYETLSSKNVKLVRCLWTDMSGIRRMRAVPLKRFFQSTVKHGLALCQAIQAFPMHCDMLVDSTEVSATGEFHLHPDLATLRQVTHHPNHAVVLGNLLNGQAYCPRSILQQAVDKAKSEFGLDILSGFEYEFVILKNFPEEYTPFDEHLYAESSALYRFSPLMDKIYDSLLQQDIEPQLIHAEACPGQFELSGLPSDPIKAADNCILTKETIYEVAAQQGLRATLCPKPFNLHPGNGMHCHLSIWKDGVNLFEDAKGKYQIGEAAEHFTAGILHNLPAIIAFTLPSLNSYRRLLPHYWSGAYQIWGPENRDAPVRLCSPPGCTPNTYSNVEVKSVDGTCNPYLALSALIHAGLDGLRHKRQLPTPVRDTETDGLKDSLRLLPKSLEEAVGELEKNEALQAAFGPFAKHFAAIRKCEINALSNLSFEEERTLISKRF